MLPGAAPSDAVLVIFCPCGELLHLRAGAWLCACDRNGSATRFCRRETANENFRSSRPGCARRAYTSRAATAPDGIAEGKKAAPELTGAALPGAEVQLPRLSLKPMSWIFMLLGTFTEPLERTAPKLR